MAKSKLKFMGGADFARPNSVQCAMKKAGRVPAHPRATKHCSRGTQACAQCFWESKGSSLMKEFSWLKLASCSSDTPLVGCIICRAAHGPTSAYAEFKPMELGLLRKANLKRHQQSPQHAEAGKILAGRATTIDLEKDAPSLVQWKALWDTLRSKRFMERVKEAEGEIFRAKARKMQYCLAEALRFRQRNFLDKASCLTLSIDAAETRLLVRFTGVTPDLEVMSGVLGMTRSKDTGHRAILQQLKEVITRAATSLIGAPVEAGQSATKTGHSFDQSLFDKICRAVRVWNSDAAPDEMLAAKTSEIAADDVRPLLPNLTIINRDRAHASRRVAKRPWLCSQQCMEVFKTFTDWISAIQYSSLLQGWFEEFQQQEGQLTLQRNMQYAAHRFDSVAKPFAICLCTFPSVVLTAVKAVNERKHAAAKSFLTFISGRHGLGNLLLAGMLADASDECLLLARAFDHERCHISLLHSEVGAFLNRIDALFVKGQCMGCGFTNLMLQQAKRQYAWFSNSDPQTIGSGSGVPADLMQQCRQQMAAWSGICVKVLQTEFPSFDLMGSFRIFALGGQRRQDTAEGFQDDLDRLCKARRVQFV